MSKKRYPYAGLFEKSKSQKNCDVCKKKGTDYKVWVEVSWFRGDDDLYVFCAECKPNFLKWLHSANKVEVIC